MDEIVPPVKLDKPENQKWKTYMLDVTDNIDYDYPQVSNEGGGEEYEEGQWITCVHIFRSSSTTCRPYGLTRGCNRVSSGVTSIN